LTVIRRLFVFVAGLAVLVLLTILALAPDQVSTVNIYVRGAVVVLVDAIIVVLLFRQLRGERRTTTNGGLMVRAGGAITDVSIDSARERILRAVREVPDVTSATARVEAKRGRADVDLDVIVSGDTVNIPNKQKEIDRALRQVINKELGLQMAEHPRVHIQFQPPPGAVSPPVSRPVETRPAEVPPAVPRPIPPSPPVVVPAPAPSAPAVVEETSAPTPSNSPPAPVGLKGLFHHQDKPDEDDEEVDTVKLEEVSKPPEMPPSQPPAAESQPEESTLSGSETDEIKSDDTSAEKDRPEL
jgi:hypothetical protein